MNKEMICIFMLLSVAGQICTSDMEGNFSFYVYISEQLLINAFTYNQQ